MSRWLFRLCIEHTFEIVAAVITYVVARWLLDLSTPEKDYLIFYRWWPLEFELRWYRGPEYYHQLRGMRLLWQVLPTGF